MDVHLSGAPRGLPQHGAYGVAGVCMPARHAAAHAATQAALLGVLDVLAVVAGYLPRRT